MVLRVRTKTHHHRVVRQEKRKWAHLRKAPSAQQSLASGLKKLITSACLKHSDFLKIDNWIEMCPTAVHMKPFSMKERVRRLGSTNSVQLLMRSESDYNN